MLNVYHSPAHIFCSLYLSLPARHQLWRMSKLQQSPICLQFPVPDMAITTNVTSIIWFLFSELPLSCSVTLSDSIHKVYIAMQELQAVALLLHRVGFQLSGKVVA